MKEASYFMSHVQHCKAAKHFVLKGQVSVQENSLFRMLVSYLDKGILHTKSVVRVWNIYITFIDNWQ